MTEEQFLIKYAAAVEELQQLTVTRYEELQQLAKSFSSSISPGSKSYISCQGVAATPNHQV